MRILLRIIPTFVFGICLSACSSISDNESELLFSDAKILNVSERLALSGYVKTWISVVFDDGEDVRMAFIPYLTPDQSLPKKGSQCIINVEKQIVQGAAVGINLDAPRREFVVKNFECLEPINGDKL